MKCKHNTKTDFFKKWPWHVLWNSIQNTRYFCRLIVRISKWKIVQFKHLPCILNLARNKRKKTSTLRISSRGESCGRKGKTTSINLFVWRFTAPFCPHKKINFGYPMVRRNRFCRIRFAPRFRIVLLLPVVPSESIWTTFIALN